MLKRSKFAKASPCQVFPPTIWHSKYIGWLYWFVYLYCVCILKAWRERYFVLQDGKLIYYKDSKKVHIQSLLQCICVILTYYVQTDPPQGIIDLAGATMTRNNHKKEHGLDIIVSLLQLCWTFSSSCLVCCYLFDMRMITKITTFVNVRKLKQYFLLNQGHDTK